MKRLASLVALLLVLGTPAAAAAHPLGNFTVNQYSQVVIGADAIAVRYVVDRAEIPAFQERQVLDTDDDGTVTRTEADAYLDATLPRLLDAIVLRIDGDRIELALAGRDLTFPPGQGGLTTMRLVVDLTAPLASPEGSGTYRVDAFPDRLGWREVVVQSGDGIELASSSMPAAGVSDELRSYPPAALDDPLQVTEATFAFRPGTGSSPAPGGQAPGSAGSDDRLSSLLRGELSLVPALLALALSALLGAAHAVSPGHGKTLVAAYLIGSGGSLRQAMWLGVTVAATHTVGILVLGAATLIAAEVFVPERVIGVLAVVAGITVILLGAGLLVQQLRNGPTDHAHDHDHADGHDHSHGHADPGRQDDSEHLPDREHTRRGPGLSTRRVVGLGMVGGLVPSTSALLVLLLAITLDRLVFGIALILAFGAGMAVVLAAIAASVVLLRDRARRAASPWGSRWGRRLQRTVPIVSALVVLAVGVVATVGAAAALV